MAEPLVMADSSDKNSEESCSRKCEQEDRMWNRIFRDKPITLTELLESSPEAQQLKKHNFHLHSDNNISWSGSFSIGNHHRKRSLLPSSSNIPVPFNSNHQSFPSSSCSNSIHFDLLNTSKLASVLTSSSCHPPTSSSSSSSISSPFDRLGKRKLKSNDNQDDDHEREWDNSTKTFPHQMHLSSSDDKEIQLESVQVGVVESKCLYKMKKNNCVLPMRPKYFHVASGRILQKPIIDSFDYHNSRVPCPQRKQRKKTSTTIPDKLEMVAEVTSTVAHL